MTLPTSSTRLHLVSLTRLARATARSRAVTRACAATLLVAAFACGGGAPPNDQVAQTQGAIRAAEEAGADANPRAALYLKLAKEEIEKARVLIDNGDNDRAKRMLSRAEADAELARVVARGKKLEDEAQDAFEQVEKLKQSLK